MSPYAQAVALIAVIWGDDGETLIGTLALVADPDARARLASATLAVDQDRHAAWAFIDGPLRVISTRA